MKNKSIGNKLKYFLLLILLCLLCFSLFGCAKKKDEDKKEEKSYIDENGDFKQDTVIYSYSDEEVTVSDIFNLEIINPNVNSLVVHYVINGEDFSKDEITNFIYASVYHKVINDLNENIYEESALDNYEESNEGATSETDNTVETSADNQYYLVTFNDNRDDSLENYNNVINCLKDPVNYYFDYNDISIDSYASLNYLENATACKYSFNDGITDLLLLDKIYYMVIDGSLYKDSFLANYNYIPDSKEEINDEVSEDGNEGYTIETFKETVSLNGFDNDVINAFKDYYELKLNFRSANKEFNSLFNSKGVK